MGQPVVLLPVLGDCCLHYRGQSDMESHVDDALGPLDHPGEDGGASILVEVLGIVLDIAAPGDPGVERHHNEPPPSACVNSAHLGQMVGVQHQRVAGDKTEWVLVLLLRIDLIGGTHLLHRGGVQPGAFLQLGGDHQPLAFQLRHLRLDVAAVAHGQCIGGHVAAVGAKHTGQRVPEGGLAVGPAAIGDDHLLDEHLPDAGGTGYELHIVHQIPVAAEQEVKLFLPEVGPLVTGGHRGHLGHEVAGVMRPATGHPQTKVIGSLRGTEKIAVCVQLLRRDGQHGAGLLQCVGDVPGAAPIQGEAFVLRRLLVLHIGGGLVFGEHSFRLLLAHGGEYLGSAVLRQHRPGILGGGGGLLQLIGGQLLSHGLRPMLGLLPIGAVVADIVGGR